LKLNSQYLGRALGPLQDECGIWIGRIPKVAHAGGDLWKNLSENNSNHLVTLYPAAKLSRATESHRFKSATGTDVIGISGMAPVHFELVDASKPGWRRA
jgi:hypothetical protein